MDNCVGDLVSEENVSKHKVYYNENKYFIRQFRICARGLEPIIIYIDIIDGKVKINDIIYKYVAMYDIVQ